MSPKPFDVDRAVLTLRQESATAETTANARHFVSSHHLSRNRRPTGVILATTVIAITAMLWPLRGKDSTWAETVSTMLKTVNIHLVSGPPGSSKTLEEWRSGAKRATVLYTRGGEVLCEMRSNGKHSIIFFDQDILEKRRTRNPNAHRFANVAASFSEAMIRFESPLQSLESFLGQKGLKVLSHEAPRSGSKFETYHILLRGIHKDDEYVDVDPDTHRIQSIRSNNGRDVETLSYPESLPESAFDPVIQVAKGVETYDLSNQCKEARHRIQSGLGKQGPITLRLLLLDADGNLWAFWTGSAPDHRLSRPISIPGIKVRDKQTFAEFTNDPAKVQQVLAPSIHQHLGGMAVTPLAKLGDTTNIDIPYPGGAAHFKNVPILRIGLLSHFKSELGAKNL